MLNVFTLSQKIPSQAYWSSTKDSIQIAAKQSSLMNFWTASKRCKYRNDLKVGTCNSSPSLSWKWNGFILKCSHIDKWCRQIQKTLMRQRSDQVLHRFLNKSANTVSSTNPYLSRVTNNFFPVSCGIFYLANAKLRHDTVHCLKYALVSCMRILVWEYAVCKRFKTLNDRHTVCSLLKHPHNWLVSIILKAMRLY